MSAFGDRLEGTLQLDAEAWLRQRLTAHGVLAAMPDLKQQVSEVDLGATTTASRAERMRQLILKHHLEAVIAGSRKRKPETYADLFERVYGAPLITDAMRAAAAELRRRKP